MDISSACAYVGNSNWVTIGTTPRETVTTVVSQSVDEMINTAVDRRLSQVFNGEISNANFSLDTFGKVLDQTLVVEPQEDDLKTPENFEESLKELFGIGDS